MQIFKDINTHRFTKMLFFLLIGLLSWPLFKVTYFITHDGPSHIYNAGLIKQIISGEILPSDFLVLKKFPEPNWIGHFILAVLSMIFSPAVSEKIFLGFYILLLPFFFSRLIKIVNQKSFAVSFLIFPFVYTNFFFLGVYNFLSGVVILFASLCTILPMFENNGRKKYWWILFFSVLLYFSHLLALCIFILMIGLAHVFSFKKAASSNNSSFLLSMVKSSVPLIAALVPAGVMVIIFISKKSDIPTHVSPVSVSEMLDFLFHIAPIITLTYSPEDIYAVIIFSLIALLVIYRVFSFNRFKEVIADNSKRFYQKSPYWLTATLLMLIFFFFIPDEAATGGVVKFRFELFFYLFLIIFLSIVPFKKIINTGLVLIITCWIILKSIYLFPMIKNLDDDTKLMMQSTEHMNENSILLPLNYSANWMHCNFFNYAGTVKNIFVLDNYEATTPHFPLEWKKGRNPIEIMGEFTVDPPPLCADIPKFEKVTNHNIDYVIVWHYQQLTDSCTLFIQSELASKYHLIYSVDERMKLYQRN